MGKGGAILRVVDMALGTAVGIGTIVFAVLLPMGAGSWRDTMACGAAGGGRDGCAPPRWRGRLEVAVDVGAAPKGRD